VSAVWSSSSDSFAMAMCHLGRPRAFVARDLARG